LKKQLSTAAAALLLGSGAAYAGPTPSELQIRFQLGQALQAEAQAEWQLETQTAQLDAAQKQAAARAEWWKAYVAGLERSPKK
jgi:hypothetical protein